MSEGSERTIGTVPESGDSYVRRTWMRCLGRPAGVAGLVVVSVAALASLLAPLISPYGLDEVTSQFRAAPSSDHWLGTDAIGKDTFSQLLFGLRTSLWASVVAVTLARVALIPRGLWHDCWPPRARVRRTDRPAAG